MRLKAGVLAALMMLAAPIVGQTYDGEINPCLHWYNRNPIVAEFSCDPDPVTNCLWTIESISQITWVQLNKKDGSRDRRAYYPPVGTGVDCIIQVVEDLDITEQDLRDTESAIALQ